MIKLGLLSAILPDQSFEEVIDIAAQFQLAAVEVACWPNTSENRRYAGITHIDIDTLTSNRIEKIKNYCKEKGVQISSLGYYPNPLSPNKETREVAINHLYKLIDAARKLDVNMVTTFIGRDPNKNIEESLEEFVKVWTNIILYAEVKQVKIAIENCPMLFSKDEWPGGKNLAISPAIFRKMFSLIPSDNFGLNFDPSHYVWQQMDYIKTIHDFKDKIFHVHFKDIKLHHDKLNEVGILATPLEYMDPKIPGHGDVDWKAFIQALKDVKYEGYCALEIEDKEYEDSFDNIIKAIELSTEYICSILN